MSDPFWNNPSSSAPIFSGPLPAKKKRATTGVRRPTTYAELPVDSGFEAVAAEEQYFDAEDVGWDAGTAAAVAALAAAAAAGESSALPERAGSIRNPAAGARAVQDQLKWDGIRPDMHRSYVENAEGQRQLNAARLAAEKAALETVLAALPRWCKRCGSCDLEPCRPATVLVVMVHYRFTLEVPLARCSDVACGGSWAPSPFAVGCLPATHKASWDLSMSGPGQPARWFDLRLLHLGDDLIFEGRRPAAVHSFAAIVHRQHEANGCSEPLGWEHFKRQLHEAVMEYGYLMCALLKLANLGVRGLPSGPLSGCAVCARAGMAHPLHSLCVDFNFALVHYERCGSAGIQLEPPNRELYLVYAAYAALLADSSSAAACDAAAAQACSDFNAATALARTSEKYDVTAVGSTMCRHSIVAHLMDIATGERYIYAAVMLYALMVTYAMPILFVWYDINCRFSAYFRQWATNYPLLSQVLLRVLTKYPLPTWHRYSHSAACQEKNDGLYMQLAGQQYNEVNETLWAVIGAHGATTQYMTQRNRKGRLERATQLYNRRQAARIVTLLCDMTAKAVRVRDAADAQLTALLELLATAYGCNSTQALDLVEQRTTSIAQSKAPALRPSAMAEYGQLRLQQEYVSNTAAANLPPPACLFRDSALERVTLGSSAANAISARVRSLERDLFNGVRPTLQRLPSGQAVADVQLAAAVAAWACFETERLQAQLTRMAQQVQLLEQLITRLTSRPGEAAKLRKSKQQLKQRMEPALSSLMHWRAGGYVGFDQLPQQMQRLAPAVDAASGWSLADICRGVYPWEDGSNAAAVAAATAAAATTVPVITMEQVVTKMHRFTCERERAEEELKLLAEERVRCLTYFREQEAAIVDATMRLAVRQAALEAAGADVPDCTSFQHQQPANSAERFQEAKYCAGLLMLLSDRLQECRCQLAAAQSAFMTSDWDAAAAEAAAAAVDYEEDEDEAAL